MQKLEVLIEEHAFGSVRPVEVVADVPVAALLPALIEELNLPQVDLFGKKLVYMLRKSPGGRILPEHTTLLAAGVKAGSRLTLDSFVLDGTVATLSQSAQMAVPDESPLHSSVTIADGEGFGPLDFETPPGNWSPAPKKRSWTRRAFLLFGTAALGVGMTAGAYAAYRAYAAGTLSSLLPGSTATQPAKTQQGTTSPKNPPQKGGFPTNATALFTFMRHQGAVRSISWSPDGMLLASGADDQHVFTWTLDGAVQQDLAHQASVQTLAWAPDSQRLVTGSGNQVTFFDAQGGTVLADTNGHLGTVTSLAWTPHNQMQVVSGAQDARVLVWNTTTYTVETRFVRHTTAIADVSWAADGQSVASATQGGVIRVWNAANPQQELHGPYAINVAARVLAFAPTGAQLALGSNDGIVRIWNGLTCQQQMNAAVPNQCVDAPLQLRVSNVPIRALAWSSDGRYLAVGAQNGLVTIWNPAQSQQPLLKMQQDGNVRSLAWSPRGDQLAVASGNTITIFKLT